MTEGGAFEFTSTAFLTRPRPPGHRAAARERHQDSEAGTLNSERVPLPRRIPVRDGVRAAVRVDQRLVHMCEGIATLAERA